MTKKELKHKIKEEQKLRATQLRNLKASRKEDKRGDRQLWEIELDIKTAKETYRVNHIA